jgi:enamine deaminase RidA (YjgF/YER057c/UK114 family)
VTITRFQPGARFAAAVRHNDTVYVAGQVADTVTGSIEVQTREVLQKMDTLLALAGTDKSRLLAISVYLAHISDFDAMNAVFDGWVDTANLPTRATVEARLADPDLRVEMTAIAAMPA